MRVTLLLADSAQAVGGKLYILGGGWSLGGPGPIPMAIATKIAVPWSDANVRHTMKLALLTEDDQPVKVPGPAGPEQTVEIKGEFEVGRPPGLTPGTELDAVFAVNLPPLSLAPGGYVWRCSINGESKDDWKLTFSVRKPTPKPK